MAFIIFNMIHAAGSVGTPAVRNERELKIWNGRIIIGGKKEKKMLAHFF